MEAAEVTLLVGLGLMGLTLIMVLADTFVHPGVLSFERQRWATVVCFLVVGSAIVMRNCL